MKKFLILLMLSGGLLFAQIEIPMAEELIKMSKTKIEDDKLLQSLFYYYQFTDQIVAGDIDKEKTIFKARDLAEEYFVEHNQPLYKAYFGLVESCCLGYRVFPIVIFKSRHAIKLLKEALQENPSHWQIRYFRLISFVNYPSKYYDFEDIILEDYHFLSESKISVFEMKMVDFFMGKYYLEKLEEPQEALKYLNKITENDAKLLGIATKWQKLKQGIVDKK